MAPAEPKRVLSGRLTVFFKEMFPPHLMVLGGTTKFFSAYLLLQALAGRSPATISARAIAGAATLCLFMLMVRVFDELKDVESDKQLADAGDPRYIDRPIVRGAVLVSDMRLLAWTATLTMFALQLSTFSKLTLLTFSVVYFVLWLSSRWFFYPKMKESLLLALVTHSPLTLFALAYVTSVFAADYGTETLGPWTVVLLLGLWAPMVAWETSRKQRVPEEETSYETYTQIFGLAWAPFVPLACVLVSVGCTSAIMLRAGLSWAPLVLAASALVPIGAYLRFRLWPTPKHSKLQVPTEVYVFMADAVPVAAVIIEAGLLFRL